MWFLKKMWQKLFFYADSRRRMPDAWQRKTDSDPYSRQKKCQAKLRTDLDWRQTWKVLGKNYIDRHENNIRHCQSRVMKLCRPSRVWNDCWIILLNMLLFYAIKLIKYLKSNIYTGNFSHFKQVLIHIFPPHWCANPPPMLVAQSHNFILQVVK